MYQREALIERAVGADDVREVFTAVSPRLQRLVPFDAIAWMVIDPATTMPTVPTRVENLDDYGAQKAASERVADAAVRAGLLCGPHDNVFRLPWWVRRIAAGGRVPAPGDPERTVQLIDARDLAAWMLDLGERRVSGAFNGTAPRDETTMREVLEAAVTATGSGAELVWTPDERLLEAGVEPWTELPLWLPAPGTWDVGTERAQEAGLRCRAVGETVADVWTWLRDGGEAELDEWRSEHRPLPMSAKREEQLLALHW